MSKMGLQRSFVFLTLALVHSNFIQSLAFSTQGLRNSSHSEEGPFEIHFSPATEEPSSLDKSGATPSTSSKADKAGKSLLTSLTSAWKDRLSSFFSPGNQQKNDRKDASPKPSKESSDREGRFLNLFTVVRFNNTECRSESGDNGTCYTANECVRKGGVVGGACAGDFGVCCLFLRTCGENTTANNTYFVNRNYPSTSNTPGSCQLVVHKCAPDVCQLRLDFVRMKLAGPSVDERTFGQCLDDQFLVSSGASTATPTICGENTGQHMYVDVSSTNEAAVLTVITNSIPQLSNRNWKIKVTQIKCSDVGKANTGCLQWHLGVSGRIESFNFNNARGRQLSNQDYSVCVRPEAGFCGIRYSQCVDNFSRFTRSFSLTGNAGPPDETAQNQPARVSEVSEFCALGTDKDWITIPCGTNNPQYGIETNTPGAFCPDRFCGTVINPVAGQNVAAQVYSSRKPFVLYYHTDEAEVGSIGNVGFCLDYVQQPCGATPSG